MKFSHILLVRTGFQVASDSESDMDASDAEEDEEAEVTTTKSEKQVKVTMKLIEQWSTKLRVCGPHRWQLSRGI